MPLVEESADRFLHFGGAKLGRENSGFRFARFADARPIIVFQQRFCCAHRVGRLRGKRLGAGKRFDGQGVVGKYICDQTDGLSLLRTEFLAGEEKIGRFLNADLAL